VRTPRPDSDPAGGNGYLDVPMWQYDFLAVALGWGYDLNISSNANLATVRDHSYKCVIGRLGGAYCYRRSIPYETPLSTVEPGIGAGTDYFADWGAVYSALMTRDSLSSVTCASGLSLLEGASDMSDPQRWSTSYAGNILMACAYAVDHGASGASTSYALLANSTSWSMTSAFADNPKYGIVPR
jgi:hypothetical protein